MQHRMLAKGLGAITILVLLFTSAGSARIAATTGAATSSAYVPGELLVKLRDGVTPEARAGALSFTGAPGLTSLASQVGVLAAEPLFADAAPSPAGLERIFKLTLPKGSDPLAAVEALAADPSVEYAEPNYIFTIPEPASIGQSQRPDDDRGQAPTEGQPLLATDVTLPDDAKLPFAGNNVKYTGGPHLNSFCDQEFITQTSALDFAGDSLTVLSIAEGKFIGKAVSGSKNSDKPTAGNYVLIEHQGGIQSMYWHMAEFSPELLALTPGQWIPQGFPLGTAGDSYKQDSIHLHLRLTYGAKLADPYLNKDGQHVPWDGKTLDGWTFWNLRVPGSVGKGIGYRGTATRGPWEERELNNINCDTPTKVNAIVAKTFPDTKGVAINAIDTNTVFADHLRESGTITGSAIITSTNHINRLTISEAPAYDFGERTVGEDNHHEFTIRNHGEKTITNLSAWVGGLMFSFDPSPSVDGRYPGDGTCRSELAGKDHCTIVVYFVPTVSGTHTGTLEVLHTPAGDSEQVAMSVALSGTGVNSPLVIPNDPLFPDQYGLHNTGQNRGLVDADIDGPEGWGIMTGTESVTVAVIDTGIDYLHEDLNDGRVLANLDWDYVNNDDNAIDDNGHGTHVAGIIAAETNNGVGIAGVMWQAKLLPLKVCDKQGSCNVDHVAQAVRDAANKGARVINLGLGGFTCSNALTDAINYAHFDKGAVVVAAAGNNGGGINFPASLDAVIAVGATDKYDLRVASSNSGPQLDVMAPGKDIWSTVPKKYDPHPGPQPTALFSETSMAAAFVSGVAGLLIAQRPVLTNEQVRDILRRSADDRVIAGFDPQYGYGRVNLGRALQTLASTSSVPSSRGQPCPVCGASAAAVQDAGGAGLLTNIRTLRDTVFQQDPGRRWAHIYYEHQLEVALMVATTPSLSGEVLSGWHEFDPVFQRLMDEDAPPVTLTPELIAAAQDVMMGVAARGSPAVRDVIVSEWQQVDPKRFVGWEVRDVWTQLVAENERSPQVYLPLLKQ